MASLIAEEKKRHSYIEDEEDALLNEAICCSRNLEIKTDDDEDESEDAKNVNSHQEATNLLQPINPKPTNIPWYDMNSSDSSQNVSDSSNGKIDLSLSGGKVELIAGVNSSNIDYAFRVSNKGSSRSSSEETDLLHNGKNHREPVTKSQSASPVRKRLRNRDVYDEDEAAYSRNRKTSTSSSSTVSNGHKRTEYEKDRAVLARRQKDIDYGKNTIGYDRYIREVPKEQRTKEHPRTPPMHIKYSRRGWDGMVKLWRKQLHNWDPVEDSNDKVEDNVKMKGDVVEEEVKDESVKS
ncbi:hypothetical protein TKK_0007367 [Trichogramma kaykai]